MYKKIIIIIPALCFLISCSQKSKTENSNSEILKNDSVTLKAKTKTPLPEKADRILVGAKIEGDFDGDGKNEFAIVTKTKTGEGNPVEDGTPDEYTISFSNTSLKPIVIGCCEAQLINEGDLNEDGKDEFSVFQAPMNGCTYSMTTYSLQNSNWKQVIEPFLISTGCDGFTYDELQNRIFIENKTVYKLETDPNDESLKLFRKKIDLK
ncbi:hypothetical protein [Flavobacterium reichenbachii]|uniref:Lipoprotein n=1 Tax=Flavobacterium reichenbachii TaxID=362418 RepID=A0A085ZD93_9FLAO|nr:hypothetical protein [Flavobacterium reichenbachii]KFF02407.1 hypothetical protein IW19_24255 [Flavobacterium reichenbachii]OXB13616.1 hypothetical protein B0A68_14795 [Flavobacterium reichenbachii]